MIYETDSRHLPILLLGWIIVYHIWAFFYNLWTIKNMFLFEKLHDFKHTKTTQLLCWSPFKKLIRWAYTTCVSLFSAKLMDKYQYIVAICLTTRHNYGSILKDVPTFINKILKLRILWNFVFNEKGWDFVFQICQCKLVICQCILKTIRVPYKRCLSIPCTWCHTACFFNFYDCIIQMFKVLILSLLTCPRLI